MCGWFVKQNQLCLLLTSSSTSRMAASLGPSPGSTPPEGTIHLPGCRQLETNNTYQEQTCTQQSNRAQARPAMCNWTTCQKPLSPVRFWSRYSQLFSRIRLHRTFWHCFAGSSSFFWLKIGWIHFMVSSEKTGNLVAMTRLLMNLSRAARFVINTVVLWDTREAWRLTKHSLLSQPLFRLVTQRSLQRA